MPSSEREEPSERTETLPHNAREKIARQQIPGNSTAGLSAGTEKSTQPLPTIMVSADPRDRTVLGAQTAASKISTRDMKGRTSASQHPVEVPTLVVARPVLEQRKAAPGPTKATATVESQQREAVSESNKEPSQSRVFPDIKIQEATGGRFQGDIVQVKEAQVKLVNVSGAQGRTSTDQSRLDRQPNGAASTGIRGQPRIDVPHDDSKPLKYLELSGNDKQRISSRAPLGLKGQPDAAPAGQQSEATPNSKTRQTVSKPSSFGKQDDPAQDLKMTADKPEPLRVGQGPQQPEAPVEVSERYTAFSPLKIGGGQGAFVHAIPQQPQNQAKASDFGRGPQRRGVRQDESKEQLAPKSLKGDSRDDPSRTARAMDGYGEASRSAPDFQGDPRIAETERREIPSILSPGYQSRRGQIAKELPPQLQSHPTNVRKTEVSGQSNPNAPAQHNVSRAVQSRQPGSLSGEIEQRGNLGMLAASQQRDAHRLEMSLGGTVANSAQKNADGTARYGGREQRNDVPEESTRQDGSRANNIERRDGIPDILASRSAGKQPYSSASKPLPLGKEQQSESSERPKDKQFSSSSAQKPPGSQTRVNATQSVSPLASLERMIEQGSWQDIQTRPSNVQSDQQATPKSRKPIDEREYIDAPRPEGPVRSENLDPLGLKPKATLDTERARGEELSSFTRKAVPPALSINVDEDRPAYSADQGRDKRSQHHTRRDNSEQAVSKSGPFDGEKWSSVANITVVDKSGASVVPPYSHITAPVPPEIAPPSLARNQSALPTPIEVQHQPNEITLTPAGRSIKTTTSQEKNSISTIDSNISQSKALKEVTRDVPPRPQQPLRSSTFVTEVRDAHPVKLVSGGRKGANAQPVAADIIQVPWSQRYFQPEPEETAQSAGTRDSEPHSGAVETKFTTNASTSSQPKVEGPKVIETREVVADGRNSEKDAMASKIEEQVSAVSGISTSTSSGASHKRGFWDLFGTSSNKAQRPDGSDNIASSQPAQLPPQRPVAAAPPLDWRTQIPALSDIRAERGLAAPVQPAELTRAERAIPDCLLAPSPTTFSPPTAPFGQISTVAGGPGVESQHSRASNLQHNEQAKALDVPLSTAGIDKKVSSSLEPPSVGPRGQAPHAQAPPAQDQTSSASASTGDQGLDLPSYLLPMAKSDSSSPRAPREVTVNHAAMSSEASLSGPGVTFKPTNAQSRRKSNRMASMYGSQLSFGPDVPNLPAIPTEGLVTESRGEDKAQNDELRDRAHGQTQSGPTDLQSSDSSASSKQPLITVQPNVPSSLCPGPPNTWFEEANANFGAKTKPKFSTPHTGIHAVVGRETDLDATSQPEKLAAKPLTLTEESDVVRLKGKDESLNTKDEKNGGWLKGPFGMVGTSALTNNGEARLLASRVLTPAITDKGNTPDLLHITPLNQDNLHPSIVIKEKSREQIVAHSPAAPQTPSNSKVQNLLGDLFNDRRTNNADDESLLDNDEIASLMLGDSESNKTESKIDEVNKRDRLAGSDIEGSRALSMSIEAAKVNEDKPEETVTAPSRLRFEGETRPSSLWNRRKPKTSPELNIDNLEDEVCHLPIDSVGNSRLPSGATKLQDGSSSKTVTQASELSVLDNAIPPLGRCIVAEEFGTGESAKEDLAPSSTLPGIEAAASLPEPSIHAADMQEKSDHGEKEEGPLSLPQRITQKAALPSALELNTTGRIPGHLQSVHDIKSGVPTSELIAQFPIPGAPGETEAADTAAISEPKDTVTQTLAHCSADEPVSRSIPTSNRTIASTVDEKRQQVHEIKDDEPRGDQSLPLLTVSELSPEPVVVDTQTPSALRPQIPIVHNALLSEDIHPHEEDEHSTELPPPTYQDAMLDYKSRRILHVDSPVPMRQSLTGDTEKGDVLTGLPIGKEFREDAISPQTGSPALGVQGETAQNNREHTTGSPAETLATGQNALQQGTLVTMHEALTESPEQQNFSPNERHLSRVGGDTFGEHHSPIMLDPHREDSRSWRQTNDILDTEAGTPIAAQTGAESLVFSRCLEDSEDSSQVPMSFSEPLTSHRRSLATNDDSETEAMEHPAPVKLSFKDRMRNVFGNADRNEKDQDARTQGATLLSSSDAQFPHATQSPRSVDEREAADSDVADHDGLSERTSMLWTQQVASPSTNTNHVNAMLEPIISSRKDSPREGPLSLSGRSLCILRVMSRSACSNTAK